MCWTIRLHFSLRQIKLCIGQQKYKQKFTTQGRIDQSTDQVADQPSEWICACSLNSYMYFAFCKIVIKNVHSARTPWYEFSTTVFCRTCLCIKRWWQETKVTYLFFYMCYRYFIYSHPTQQDSTVYVPCDWTNPMTKLEVILIMLQDILYDLSNLFFDINSNLWLKNGQWQTVISSNQKDSSGIINLKKSSKLEVLGLP